jgi:hypothetical protein
MKQRILFRRTRVLPCVNKNRETKFQYNAVIISVRINGKR